LLQFLDSDSEKANAVENEQRVSAIS
jgi:hypothetical protein